MIILDEEDQDAKIASPLPLHVRTNRPSTPTPSLPDYETSQEQLKEDLKKRKPLSKRWKWALWGLGAYFVVTVAIGVPLIIVKTRSRTESYMQGSMFSWTSGVNDTTSPSTPPVFNLGAFPICVDQATQCDMWTFKDKFDGHLWNAHLEYYVPMAETVFVQSNMTRSTVTVPPISGSFNVGVSSDPRDTQISIIVDMSYTGVYIRERTSVCMVNLNDSNGVFVYLPLNLTAPDHLNLNISLLFPTTKGDDPLYVANFYTSLPYFSQNIPSVDPQVTFGNVALGGYKSNVTIDSLQAEAVLLRSPFAGASGTFNITEDDDDDQDNDAS